MNLFSAKEARKQFDDNTSSINQDLVNRVIHDISLRVRRASLTSTSIIVSFDRFSEGMSNYSIRFPLTFVERFKYNWNEGSLLVDLTDAEINKIVNTLREADYKVSFCSRGSIGQDYTISW